LRGRLVELAGLLGKHGAGVMLSVMVQRRRKAVVLLEERRPLPGVPAWVGPRQPRAVPNFRAFAGFGPAPNKRTRPAL
jgi:hypothetical protein